MSAKTAIEWTDRTWNPVAGCAIVSPGCIHCYAMRMAHRLEKMGSTLYAGLTMETKAGPVWTGDVRLSSEKNLTAPLRWKQPHRVFVNSMSDLFHESLRDEDIDMVFAVMALAPQHTFQVLTKRAERMREWMLAALAGQREIGAAAHQIGGMAAVEQVLDAFRAPNEQGRASPLPNVWLGVSAEDQPRYDERKEHLRNTPAARRFFSMEPLLGPIHADYLGDWVIAGGESGAKARPMHPDWARALRDQCQAAGVPFFFKQWGEWLPGEANRGQFDPKPMHAYRRCDNHSYEWPPGNAVENFGTHPDKHSGDFHARRVGKKAAGALLDGREHREFPV